MITVIALVRDEEILLPFFLRHYECIADRILIYDNGSKDGTVDIATEHPLVSLRHFDTEGLLKDSVLLDLKNNIYRSEPGEWFIIVDCDEFIWHHTGVKGYLEKCSLSGVTLPKVSGYQMLGTAIPHNDGKNLLTSAIRRGVPDSLYSKRIAVHKDVIINYDAGCHACSPRGRLVESEDVQLKLLHYRWLSEEYSINKANVTARRMSEENLRNGWGIQYLSPEQMSTWYRSALENATDII